MPGLLSEKTIFLTGGSAGIGLECAKAYAREGAKVAICCPDLKEARQTAQSLGENHIGLGCDVSNGTQVSAAIGEVLAQFGRLDAIHNNAGIASPSATLHETTEAEWDRLFAINVKGVYWTAKHGFEALKASRGCILNQWASEQPDPVGISRYLDDIHPLGFCPEGDVIAEASVYLLSANARFVTGHLMHVTGGAELGYRR